MSNLQRKVADATVRRKQNEQENRRIQEAEASKPYPWRPGAWQRASETILNGTWKRPTPLRHPILLTSDSPICSASKLQKLIGRDSVPKATVTSQIDIRGREIKQVTICDVSTSEWKKMEKKADVSPGIVEGIRVMFEGKSRFAGIVKALKEGVSLGDDNEDQERVPLVGGDDKNQEGSEPTRKAGNAVTSPPETIGSESEPT